MKGGEKVKKIEIKQVDYQKIPNHKMVTLKEMGHIFEIVAVEKRNTSINIQKLDNDYYLLKSTGEVLPCNHIENRSQSKAQVAQSLGRLRDYINTNATEPLNCKWLTLTYAENMQDTKKLYTDFKIFIKKMRTPTIKNKYKYNNCEYIVAAEPQERGAWHLHVLLIFDKKAPFIPNNELATLWGHGFTVTKKLDNIDNIGAYLTAYLGDMELDTKNKSNSAINASKIKLVDYLDENGQAKTKQIIKGGRLHLYPPKFNLYRISKGIKKPIVNYLEYNKAIKKVGVGEQPNFCKTINISDNDKFSNVITYENYNKKRNKKQ